MERKALLDYFIQSGHISQEVAEVITGSFAFKSIHKGALFLEAGKVAQEYLFLEKGFMRSYLYDTEGNEITLNIYSSNDVVFEVASFFQRIPSQEYFEATSPCTGWVLTYETLNHLFHTIPEFREFGRLVLVKGFISFKLRTLSLINKTAEERYEILLQTRPEIFEHLPLKHIAAYLGITDTSLSRIRRNYIKK